MRSALKRTLTVADEPVLTGFAVSAGHFNAPRQGGKAQIVPVLSIDSRKTMAAIRLSDYSHDILLRRKTDLILFLAAALLLAGLAASVVRALPHAGHHSCRTLSACVSPTFRSRGKVLIRKYKSGSAPRTMRIVSGTTRQVPNSWIGTPSFAHVIS